MKKSNISLNRQRRVCERDRWKGIKLNENPFLWHVNQHFSGILSNFNHLNEQTLSIFLTSLASKISELDHQGVWKKTETFVREVFVQRLRDHVLKKMAFQIGQCTKKDKDTPGFTPLRFVEEKYFDNLHKYYSYSSRIHFAHVLHCLSPGLENPSLEALTAAVDICYLNDVSDPFWQNHLTLSVIDNIQCSLFQENQFVWVNKILAGELPKHSNMLSGFGEMKDPFTVQTLLKYELQEKINQTLFRDAEFTNANIHLASKEIQLHEKEYNGFFVTLLSALHSEIEKYRNSNYDATTVQDHMRKINLYLKKFGLESSMSRYLTSDSMQARLLLNKRLKQISDRLRDPSIEYPRQLDNCRLRLYGQKLIEIENEQPVDQAKLFYHERFRFEIGQDLINSQKLIEISGGSDSLCWVAHQYAEYDLDVWEDVFAKIDFNALDMDEDILAYIMHKTFLHHYFLPEELVHPGFISKTFNRFVSDLSKKIQGRGSNIFDLENVSELVNNIRENFVSLQAKPEIVDLQRQFNEAHATHNWLEMQRLWAVFSKFQRLLLSTQKEQASYEKFPKYKAPKTGKDYSFGNDKNAMPVSYNELLDKAWRGYRFHGIKKYMRIHPSHNTTHLAYSSQKNPSKSVKMNIFPLLSELRQVGSSIGDVLTQFNPESGKSANIITPVMCFVISDKPHLKGGDHKRLIIPVNLLLLEQPQLLSKDFQDNVYNIEQEDEKNTYLKQQVNTHYQHGMRVLNQENIQDVSNEPTSLLYHSEHVLLELLRKPETAIKIMQLLQLALAQHLNGPLLPGKYKVYAATLLMYSKNSICDICTPSIIALQNSYDEKGFLFHMHNTLTDDASSFKLATTYMPFLTIVIAAQPWSPQAYEFGESAPEMPNHSKIMSNPKSHLHFAKNSIELNRIDSAKDQKLPRQFNTIIEFVNPKLSETNSTFFKGNVFMSGSKQDKFQDRVAEVNEKVNEVINNL